MFTRDGREGDIRLTVIRSRIVRFVSYMLISTDVTCYICTHAQ